MTETSPCHPYLGGSLPTVIVQVGEQVTPSNPSLFSGLIASTKIPLRTSRVGCGPHLNDNRGQFGESIPISVEQHVDPRIHQTNYGIVWPHMELCKLSMGGTNQQKSSWILGFSQNPSGNLLHSNMAHRNFVDLPIKKKGDFPVRYVSLPEGINHKITIKSP